MKSFEFNGDWEFEYRFDAFAGLQSRRGSYTSQNSKDVSDGTVRVVIQDARNNDPDPFPAQLAAIEYIQNNAQTIQHSVLESVKAEYLKQKTQWESEDWFPILSDENLTSELKNEFGVGNVFIHYSEKDKIATFGLECGCSWDEEHGVGLSMHKDTVFEVGYADTAFSIDSRTPGITLSLSKDFPLLEDGYNVKPNFHNPHPKYSKLKPWQAEVNKHFDYYLVSRRFTDEFVQRVENGEADVNGKAIYGLPLILEAASGNNSELVKYMIQRGAEACTGVITKACHYRNFELINFLLLQGYNINEQHHNRKTLLDEVQWHGLYDSPLTNKVNNEAEFDTYIAWLRSLGALTRKELEQQAQEPSIPTSPPHPESKSSFWQRLFQWLK